MNDYLPKEVREGLELAKRRDTRRKSRLKIRVDGREFAILRYWDDGFALDPQDAAHVRGFVDVYDGARHMSRCLIVASEDTPGERVFEFKRETMSVDGPALDYERDESAPVALIGS